MERTTAATSEHEHCCGNKTRPNRVPGETRECCKMMRVVLLTAQAEVKSDASKFEFLVNVPLHVSAALQVGPPRTVFVFDHGPPQSISFAESVLQRSLLGHAPPISV
jgi:hypothetical protein